MKKLLAGFLALTSVLGGAVIPNNGSAFGTAVTASAEIVKSGDIGENVFMSLMMKAH